MSNALIYFDESGDLGFKFDHPYRDGGSSRYFTIAAIYGKNKGHLKFSRVIKKLVKERKWTSRKEKKWSNIGINSKTHFSRMAVDAINKYTDIGICIAYIEKQKIPSHIREENFHLIYSWMVSEIVSKYLSDVDTISLCPDDLNQASGNNIFIDLLKKTLWFDMKLKNSVGIAHYNKVHTHGLMFADFAAGAIQDHLENGKSDSFNILRKFICLDELII